MPGCSVMEVNGELHAFINMKRSATFGEDGL